MRTPSIATGFIVLAVLGISFRTRCRRLPFAGVPVLFTQLVWKK